MAVDLTPYSFVSLDEFAAYMGKSSSDATEADRMTRALNAATAWMNRTSARNLKARNYRESVSVTTVGSTASGATTINVTSSASLKAGDDLIGTGLAIGTQVDSLPSASSVKVTRATTAIIAAGSTLSTAGGSRVVSVLDDRELPSTEHESTWLYGGAREIQLPEYPVAAANLWSIKWLDANGVATSLDLSIKRLDEATGRLYLPANAFPAGELNLLIEFRGGFEQPSATNAGQWDDWNDLARCTVRAGEVFYQDELSHRGRSSDTSLGGFTARAPKMAMPDDVENTLRGYWRVAG